MRAKHVLVPLFLAALVLAVAQAASARGSVTIRGAVLAKLHLHATTGQVVSRKHRLHSCQTGDRDARVKLPGPSAVGETERKAATVACEQPPRSDLNLSSGLKSAETSALIAAG
jgi:hypothetical protein